MSSDLANEADDAPGSSHSDKAPAKPLSAEPTGAPDATEPVAFAPEATEFTFAMGEHVATFPTDRLYVTNHMWASRQAGQRWRFGLTAYAVRLLQDVYFLDWIVDVHAGLTHRQMIGSIESKKAESDLYSPVAGKLAAINASTLEDPSLINASPYESGWLIEMDSPPEATTSLLTPEGYAKHLIEAWEVAQRTIKGQVNDT